MNPLLVFFILIFQLACTGLVETRLYQGNDVFNPGKSLRLLGFPPFILNRKISSSHVEVLKQGSCAWSDCW